MSLCMEFKCWTSCDMSSETSSKVALSFNSSLELPWPSEVPAVFRRFMGVEVSEVHILSEISLVGPGPTLQLMTFKFLN